MDVRYENYVTLASAVKLLLCYLLEHVSADKNNIRFAWHRYLIILMPFLGGCGKSAQYNLLTLSFLACRDCP